MKTVAENVLVTHSVENLKKLFSFLHLICFLINKMEGR